MQLRTKRVERFICAADALSKHKVLAAVMKACGGLGGAASPAAPRRGSPRKDGGERILLLLRSLTKEK